MKYFTRMFDVLVIFLLANGISLLAGQERTIIMLFSIIGFILINVWPSIHNQKIKRKTLRIEGDGCELLIMFGISTFVGAVYLILYIRKLFQGQWGLLAANLLIFIVVEAVIFWNGIIRVYITSRQLGIKWRIIGIVCGMIPIAHLIVLFYIIRVCLKEVTFENQKLIVNESREADKVCKTKYPLLMVHGVFFRDFRYLNYWGRIPEELKKNGAQIYYGNHQSAASVEECGRELAERIKNIVEETGCQKVNVIAHSKGGLDMRYAISNCGADSMVASLTTINTPHRGCLFADYLLNKIPESTQLTVAKSYNAALKKLGDHNPDFLKAVNDLTASSCERLNKAMPDVLGIFYQSVGSKLNYSVSGRFPLNFSYQLVKHFDGPNDGLVSDTSFPWGSRNQFLTVKGKRGISHGDMIDLNRENIDEFDVREFYVNLVSNLKSRGL